MKMKAIFTSLLMLVGLAINAQPGTKPGKDMSPGQRAENWVKKLETRITFSKEERGSMVGIFKDFFTKLKEVKKEQEATKVAELKTARNQQVKELLGEERFAKYMKYMDENEPKGPQKGGRPTKGPANKGGNPPDDPPPAEGGQPTE